MQWAGWQAIIMSDSIKKSWKEIIRVGAGRVFIVNYESLKKYFVAEIRKPDAKSPLRLNHIHFDEGINAFKSVVIDESHRVKDYKTQQSKFTLGVCKGKQIIIGLTGTPVVNKPRDLYAQLAIIGQDQNFGGYKGFMDRYCEGYDGAANLKELNFKLTKHCFYRREKKDVLTELPDKMRQIVLCDINTREEYAHALADLENYLRQYKNAPDEKIASALRGEVMVRIGILKNISARGKLQDVFETVNEVIESGEKMVLFVHLKEVVQALKARYPDALTITGDDSTSARDIAVDSFQNNRLCKLIICSIKAAGVGLTLTAASRVAFVELPWHAADCEQCEDRCHRIGQKDSVQCIYFLGKDTIDEHIYSIIDKKRGIAGEITGAKDNVQMEVIDMLSSSLFSKKGIAA
jgi:SWI/SNF-related matrix-associated actin-dependent regulator 1 of chromatin subfamily A